MEFFLETHAQKFDSSEIEKKGREIWEEGGLNKRKHLRKL